jgi:hypothetical protein
MASSVQTGERSERAPDADASHIAHQAYQILHWWFVALPVVAGLDKFAHLLVNWDQYLSNIALGILGGAAHGFMLAVGVIEVIAGLIVALRPRIGAYVVAAWLAAIVFNLLLTGRYFDVAVRDFGLMLAAIALARLSSIFDLGYRHHPRPGQTEVTAR